MIAGSRRANALLLGLLLAVAASRLPLVAPRIDEPHGWRQAETAQIARTFAEEGIDLLRPSVSWLGLHKTLVLEFPLPEGVMALLYRALGHEDLAAARLVTLAFFVGATLYLFLLVREIFDAEVAFLAAATFCALPLGIYYSRAVHVDPAVLCFSHAAAWHAVRGIERRRLAPLAAASAWAVLAVLVKAPTAFALGLPVAAWLATRFDRRIALGLALAALPALVSFAAWRVHAAAVNGAVPDLSFVPGFAADFRKHVDGSEWYFGTLAMRADPGQWAVLARRVREEVAGPAGLLLALLPVLMAPLAVRTWGLRPLAFLASWGAGVGLYVLVFFPLNVVHDYYQLPLLAPTALACALGVALVRREWARLAPRASWVIAAVLLLALVASSALMTRRHFFYGDPTRAEAGALAWTHTPPGALLVAAVEGSDRTDDPRLLYRTGRYGWSVPVAALDPALLERLRGLGASHALAVVSGEPPPNVAALAERYPAQSFALETKPWQAWLFQLSAETP